MNDISATGRFFFWGIKGRTSDPLSVSAPTARLLSMASRGASAVLATVAVMVFAVAAFAGSSTAASAQGIDTVLHNGKIVTLDASAPAAEALAVRDGKIVAIGRNADMGKLASATTRMIDLKGHTVIPGLIDSHMHAIRAALFYAREVNWIGTESIPEALDRIKIAARSAKPGQWIVVAGGWTEEQFKERRPPTQAELAAAAPDHPVYVQLFYSAALLTPAGFKALNIASDADLGPGGKLELDASGMPNGWIKGDVRTIVGLFGKLPLPSYEESLRGTKMFFRELNRLGLTGVSDPSGFNQTGPSYKALFQIWREQALTVRVTYSLIGQRPGKELEDLQALTPFLPMGFGDDMLRFNGIGETATWGMYNNDAPTDAQKQQYYEVAKWAASRGMTLTQHWMNNKSAHQLLEVFERVNQETPIKDLRWSIAHLNDAKPETLARMKALGVGWLMQNETYFGLVSFLQAHGADELLVSPPMKTAINMGLMIGAGTDAHRVNSYNPFNALQWMVDGKTVSGKPTRGPSELLSRQDALKLYTQGAAFFSHDEKKRGTLKTGMQADLAVLSKDYMSVPTNEIGRIESLLTMVGGRVVYAAGPYSKFEVKQQ